MFYSPRLFPSPPIITTSPGTCLSQHLPPGAIFFGQPLHHPGFSHTSPLSRLPSTSRRPAPLGRCRQPANTFPIAGQRCRCPASPPHQSPPHLHPLLSLALVDSPCLLSHRWQLTAGCASPPATPFQRDKPHQADQTSPSSHSPPPFPPSFPSQTAFHYALADSICRYR